mgnify:CR=1 FL=1
MLHIVNHVTRHAASHASWAHGPSLTNDMQHALREPQEPYLRSPHGKLYADYTGAGGGVQLICNCDDQFALKFFLF